MIHPTFRDINRLLVKLFKFGKNDPTRNSFVKYYMSLLEIKYFNALINNSQLFDQPIKIKQEEEYEKFAKMSRNDGYTKEKSIDYSYHQNYYKLIGIDLSNQLNTNILQQLVS